MADAADEIRELRAAVAELTARVTALESRAIIAPEPLPAKPQLESRFGLTIVNRVGAITLALGIIFFFKYAAENEWIGPLGRVLIGLAAGIALLAGAGYLHRRDQRVFSQGLAGCGLATIYIALYASFAYYKLIPEWLGFALIVAACGTAVALSVRFGNSAVATVGFIGAFLALILLRTISLPVFDVSYLLLIDGAALAIAVREQWPTLIPVNALWAVLSATFLVKGANWFISFAVLLAAIHFAAWFRSADYRRSTNWPYIVGHVAFVLALLRVIDASFAHLEMALTAASVSLALYGIAMLAFGVGRRSAVDRVLGLVFLGAVIAKLYIWDVWQLNYAGRISAFVVLGLLLLAASYIYSRWKSRTSS